MELYHAATEDFLKWMYGAHMATIRELLGPHAYMLQRYGVSPDDDVQKAVAVLEDKAPHLAKFIKEITPLH